MTIQEINKAYNRIIGSLDYMELKNAFDLTQGLIAGIRDYSFQDRLNELQDTYKYMLKYRIEGVNDPMQKQIYHNILASSYELADLVKHKALAIDSPISYYSHRRMASKETLSFDTIHKMLRDDKSTESATIKLFNKIWLSNHLNKEEYISINKILIDEELPFTVRCQIVSSILLAMLASFDIEKMTLLFDAASLDEDEVKYRALIGILITLYIYRKRSYLYPIIEQRLEALSEHFNGFNNALRTITLRFISARETEKITRKLQDEILPEMMKLGPKLSQKINLKDINPDMLGDGMNPEWQDMISNSSLGKKMMELTELQNEGADVMHSTFTHLKNFPFFREIANWFLPFTIDHSALGGDLIKSDSEKSMIDSMTMTPFMCNSDKYSLYLSMSQLPEQAKKGLMLREFDKETSEMIQHSGEELISKRGKLEIISIQYIQDLYRFFKVYPSHLDFDDIFTMPLDFHNLPVLQSYLSDDDSLLAIAEYYLRKNYFSEALTIYNRLATHNGDNSMLFEKIGYCKQMDNDLEGALEAYLHAELINPDSKWLTKRIAGCYRSLKQPEKALVYYHKCEAFNSENLSIQILIGHCHLELKQYSEALKYYYKVDYLDNESGKAWRPIAWCSFLTGKYDQARNYYKKIMENKPNTHDFLNAGHTEWALQNVKGALAFYKRAIESESGNFLRFQEIFNQDKADLSVAGIELDEIPLMLDQLRYYIDDAI